MAITTTTNSFNQKAVFHNDVDFSGNKVTIGKDLEVDGKIQVNSKEDIIDKDGNKIIDIDLSNYVTLDTKQTITANKTIGSYHTLKFLDTSGDEALSIQGSLFTGQAEFMTFRRPIRSYNQPLDNGGVIYINKTAGSLDIYQDKVTSNRHTVYTYNGVTLTNHTDFKFIYSSHNLSLPTLTSNEIIATQAYVTSNIPAYYRHSITIKFGTSGELHFTAQSKSNTIVDSLQDAITLFGNTDITCMGVTKSGYIAIMVHIGTSSTDSLVYEITTNGGSAVTQSLGTLGFTEIGDSVTAIS